MTEVRLRVLIIGGYGVFGGRIAQLLADETRLTLIITGRSIAKAQAFSSGISAKATLVPAQFDRDGDVAEQMRALEANIVVDATGPFQTYGGDPYRVVKAAIDLGIDYLDLADGSDFVSGIAQFDAQARRRGVVVLSGVSSFPVLSVAVVRHLAQGLNSVETITGGIAPSPYAGVGLNVIQAIASYAGKPVALTRDGKPAKGYGLIETMRCTICPPGRLPLRNLRFSLVDVPDLIILPPQWPGLRSIWMGAGPVPEIWHRGLNFLAWGVRFKILPSLSPFAPLFFRVINTLSWGEHRGGMFVHVGGRRADGTTVERQWHLLAEGTDGPFIPSMAVEAIVRRSIDGRRPEIGARAALTELELEDYDALFKRRTIYTGMREVDASSLKAPLYHRTLGDAWHNLPVPLKRMHSLDTTLTAAGRASVARGSNVVSRAIGWVFGFPNAGDDIPVDVRFKRKGQSEIWQRRFGSQSFSSTQVDGTGRSDKLINERFGPFVFGLAAVIDGEILRLVVRQWSAFGVPMPRALAPTGEAYEFADGGRFNFHVEIGLPLVGLLVRYRGWLEVVEG